jgi:hypothetical protein
MKVRESGIPPRAGYTPAICSQYQALAEPRALDPGVPNERAATT